MEQKETNQRLPRVVDENELKVGDYFTIKVCVLDDGRRIIPKNDMKRVLAFLGISQTEFEKMVTNKPNTNNMETLKVKIKRLNENAVIPAYAHATDAGLDLVATSKTIDEYGNVVYGTGIALEIPNGYVGLVFPRSSNSKKYLLLTNSVGVIDSGYRGEVTFKYRPSVMTVCYRKLKDRLAQLLLGVRRKAHCGDVDVESWHLNNYEYAVGDRVGQLIIIPYPKVEFEEVGELSDSDRGTGGYGSTGK